jgi:hypothetical protein
VINKKEHREYFTNFDEVLCPLSVRNADCSCWIVLPLVKGHAS